MKATQVTTVLVLMFVVTMSAGVVAGRLMLNGPRPAAAQTRPAAEAVDSPLAAELQLTAEQAARMRPIWEAARDTARASARQAERVQQEHEEQLTAMLTDEQKRKYEQLSQANHRRIAALDARRREAFRQAVDDTRKILREDQWRVYEQIIKSQVGSLPGPGDATQPTR
jgi:DNA anti-recombination protein RmuC